MRSGDALKVDAEADLKARVEMRRKPKRFFYSFVRRVSKSMDILYTRRRYLRNLTWSTTDNNLKHQTLADSTLNMEPMPMPPVDDPFCAETMETIKQNPELFKVVTSINIETFSYYLRNHPNRRLVDSVVKGLKEGFWPWASTGGGRPSVVDNSCGRLKSRAQAIFVREQRDKEVEQGRFSQSFPSLLPGMQSLPFSVVRKPQSQDFRLVFDYSTGEHPPNSSIPTDKINIPFDNLHDLGRVLRDARKTHGRYTRLVVFRSDVSSAYRCLPVHPLWQARQVVKIAGKFHVDRSNSFGCRASGDIWGVFAALVAWIAINEVGLTDILTYVDDTFSWELESNTAIYKSKVFPRKQARLLQLWDELGIPHKEKKQVFGSELTIIGMDVNTHTMKISISPRVREAISRDIHAFAVPGKERSPYNLQSLAGRISWLLTAYPLLRPGLSEMFRVISKRENMDGEVSTSLEVTALMCKELSWFVERMNVLPGLDIIASEDWKHSDAPLQLTAHATKDAIAYSSPKHRMTFSCRVDPSAFHTTLSLGALAVLSALQWAIKINFPIPARIAILTEDAQVVKLFNTLHAKDAHVNLILTAAVDLLISSKADLRVFLTTKKEQNNFRGNSPISGTMSTPRWSVAGFAHSVFTLPVFTRFECGGL